MRTQKTRISLPSRVGDAGCPCVRASIGTASHSTALAFSFSRTMLNAGRSTEKCASLSSRGVAVLLMSCEVSPKCTNSLTSDRPNWSSFSFMKYSTALTSWFVVRSISFTFCASVSLKDSKIDLRSSGKSVGDTLLSCGNGNLHKAIKYSVSTRSRYRISAASEKKGLSTEV